MLRFTAKLDNNARKGESFCYSTVTLTLDQRVRSRLRVILDNGAEAGLFLPRGTVLHQHEPKTMILTSQIPDPLTDVTIRTMASKIAPVGKNGDD